MKKISRFFFSRKKMERYKGVSTTIKSIISLSLSLSLSLFLSQCHTQKDTHTLTKTDTLQHTCTLRAHAHIQTCTHRETHKITHKHRYTCTHARMHTQTQISHLTGGSLNETNVFFFLLVNPERAVVLDDEKWKRVKESENNSQFCKNLAVAVWGTVKLKGRSVTRAIFTAVKGTRKHQKALV